MSIFKSFLLCLLMLILCSCSSNDNDTKVATNENAWNATGEPNGGRIKSLAVVNEVVYAGTNAGVFKSTNAGESWIVVNNGLTTTSITSIAIDPTNSQVVYVGTTGGVFKSINGAADWGAINSGLTGNLPINTIGVSPTDNQVVYLGTTKGIFKSINGGAGWIAVNSGLPETITGTITPNAQVEYSSSPAIVTSLVIDPTNSQVVYVGTPTEATYSGSDVIYRSGSVYKSTNGGQSWAEVAIGINEPYIDISSLTISRSNSQVLYVGVAVGTLTVGIGSSSINYSTGYVYKLANNGAAWLLANSGMNGKFVSSLAIDPTDGQVIYAASGGSVYKSTNAGLSWIAINEGLPTEGTSFLAITPRNNQILYAGTFSGVYKSTTGGI